MDDLRAFTVLTEHFESLIDDEVRAALVLLVPELTHLPPSGLGRATHEARQLARQFAKTGLMGEWQVPPRHSQAMERLVHRLTCLLEAMLDLLSEANNTQGMES